MNSQISLDLETGMIMDFLFNDGGRKAAGFKGNTGDCVVRAIAIATGLNDRLNPGDAYRMIYADLFQASRDFSKGHCRVAKAIQRQGASPRTGVHKSVYNKYLDGLGWTWVPTMSIGSGCKVHLRPDELPKGRLIVRLSRHITAVINGQLQDTYDCSRDGSRCVYGYWHKA